MAKDLCRKPGVSDATCDKWRGRFSAMGVGCQGAEDAGMRRSRHRSGRSAEGERKAQKSAGRRDDRRLDTEADAGENA